MYAGCSLNVYGNGTGMYGICHYICNNLISVHLLQAPLLTVGFLNNGIIIYVLL